MKENKQIDYDFLDEEDFDYYPHDKDWEENESFETGSFPEPLFEVDDYYN